MINGNPNKLILINANSNIEESLVRYYGTDFQSIVIPEDIKSKKELINQIKETIPDSIKCIVCADTAMFKVLAKVKKTSHLDGIPMDTAIGIPAFIAPNWRAIMYNPEEVQARLDYINSHVSSYLSGSYKVIGEGIIHSAVYPSNRQEVKEFLMSLHAYKYITCDIEATTNHFLVLPPKEEEKFKSGLHHFSNRLYSIAFAWDEHNGGAFLYKDEYKDLLVSFFRMYNGRIIYHNASYDTTQLIYHLFMSNLEDHKAMLSGLHTMFHKLDDTFLIAYLCLNSCNKPDLSLKTLAYDFAGNYAEDVSDCSKIEPKKLLEYNLKDVLATWYVYKKYEPILRKEKQDRIYMELFLPSLKVLVETQLVGLRIDIEELAKLKKELNDIYDNSINKLKTFPEIDRMNQIIRCDLCTKYNANTKTKKKVPNDFTDEFNPRSPNQLTRLLYDVCKLPVIDITEKGNPACDKDTLDKLLHHTQDEHIKGLLNILIDIKACDKIISSFIPAFERTPIMKDGSKGLFGSFNLGGTKTGRLSSSNPNLQNLPSTGSVYAKPVKKIFISPKGYVFVGADQRSLEDRISALTTRDTNKCKVYLDNYDGHCLRAYAYFGDQMPDIKQVDESTSCYRVEMDDGTVKYLTQEELDKLQNT